MLVRFAESSHYFRIVVRNEAHLEILQNFARHTNCKRPPQVRTGKHRRRPSPGDLITKLPARATSANLHAMTTPLIEIAGLGHIGIRVHDLDRSLRFYELLGFTNSAGPVGPEPVAILEHPSGLELNLVLNAKSASEPNILMDVPDKHPGITHFALLCSDVLAAKERLEAAGIPLSGGPIRLGQRARAIFVRDPDRNVIELHQRD